MLNKARIFINWIRGYGFGDPVPNGEYRFLRSFVKDGMVIFDVGANLGDYTDQVLTLARDLEVHCFEPVGSTYEQLRSRFAEHPAGAQLFLNPVGLRYRKGDASMNIYGEGFGTNSLYERRSAVAAHPSLAVS